MRVKGSVLLYIFRLCWVKNSLSAPLKQTLLSIYIYSLIFCDFPTGFYNVTQILGIYCVCVRVAREKETNYRVLTYVYVYLYGDILKENSYGERCVNLTFISRSLESLCVYIVKIHFAVSIIG